MEKLPHQEYRDDLANQLKEKRNNPDEGKDNASGYLDAKKESPEYQYNKETHIEDVEKAHNTEDKESENIKTLRDLRLEYPNLDKYLRSSYKIYEILNIHVEDGYYDEEKKEFVIEMTAQEDFQAYEGSMHGGVASFLIDIGGGIASFMDTIKSDKNVITKNIKDIKFRLPINIGDEIRVVGKVQESDEKTYTAKTTIYKKKGERELPAISGVVEMRVV